MIVRLGIPASFPRFSAAARALGAPMLVSANAFARQGILKFPRADPFGDADVALDSAGFVAMMRYGGYPWSVADYVRLAAARLWAWWAARDYCCEPEIAGNVDEVARRIRLTIASLHECREAGAAAGIAPPMPVLQGWRPADYLRCAESMGDLPPLVGVGSVCRRSLAGSDGLLAVLGMLDAALPCHVKLHLFGVKGAAISALAGHPRIASVDSMAWDFAARREKAKRGLPSCTIEHRATEMRRWYDQQIIAKGLFA